MPSTLAPQKLHALYPSAHLNKDILIIDVREPSEYAQEHIPGSINIPLKKLPDQMWGETENQTAVFHCRSGYRTQSNQLILDATPFKKKYCIEGGIEAWKSEGFPVEKNSNAPIDILRQVQLIVGTMILTGVLLSLLLSSYFLLLPLIAGIGLTIAGATGFCGMAMLLQNAPWNKMNTHKKEDNILPSAHT